MDKFDPSKPYGYRIEHVTPPLTDLRDMARDYLLASLSGFTDDDVASVWASVDRQLAGDLITAKITIVQQHRDDPPDSFRGAAAILSFEMATRRMYDADKFLAMTAVATGLLQRLVAETGQSLHEVLMSMPAVAEPLDDEPT